MIRLNLQRFGLDDLHTLIDGADNQDELVNAYNLLVALAKTKGQSILFNDNINSKFIPKERLTQEVKLKHEALNKYKQLETSYDPLTSELDYTKGQLKLLEIKLQKENLLKSIQALPIAWHDVDHVAKELDTANLVYNDKDNSFKGLEKALTKLAEKYPYMTKKPTVINQVQAGTDPQNKTDNQPNSKANSFMNTVLRRG